MALALSASVAVALSAQDAARSISVAAAGDRLAPWLARVDEMLRDGSLDIESVQDDTMIEGRSHERLRQVHRGVPVFGAQVVRQLDGSRTLTLFGRLYVDIDLDVTPSLAAETAARLAVRDAGDEAIVEGEPELGVLPDDERGYRLTYRIRVRAPLDLLEYHVDARSGAIARRESRIRSQSIIGRGVGVLGDQKKLTVRSGSGGFQTVDALRPLMAFTADFKGSLTRLNSFLLAGLVFDSDYATDSDNDWNDGAVVDAHVYTGFTYDYYFKRFGRRGFNDGNRRMVATVHPLARVDAARYTPQTRNTFINNALYLGDGFLMFGDGDGAIFDYLAGGLDVVAHEWSHGVTEAASNLTYRDEPGALNEAFSDIMGTSAEFFHQPQGSGRLRSDWLIGEDVTRFSPGYLRSMSNPRAVGDPDHYSLRVFIGTPTDNGGIHINSGIINHAFYLAVAGGTNRVSGIQVAGVGQANIERMEKIFYRGFVFYLTPGSQFIDARNATIQAAIDLYGAGGNERAQVERAWDAVGVR